MSENEKKLSQEKIIKFLKSARGAMLLDSLLGKGGKMESKKQGSPTQRNKKPKAPKPRKMDPNNKTDSANKFIKRRDFLGGTQGLKKKG